MEELGKITSIFGVLTDILSTHLPNTECFRFVIRCKVQNGHGGEGWGAVLWFDFYATISVIRDEK